MNEEETINEIVDNDCPEANQSEANTEQLIEQEGIQPPKTYKPYDFKRRSLSKDQEKNMDMLHKHFARQFSQFLSSRLFTLAEVECTAVDQMPYSDYLMSLSEPSCLCVLSMVPLQGNAVMEISPNLVFPIIEKLQGGESNPIVKNRALTKFEEFGLEHSLIDGILEALQGTWEDVVEYIKIKLERIEQEPQYAQVIPSNDTVMVVMLRVGFGLQISGFMSICYPTAMIETALIRKDETSNAISSNCVSKDELTEIRYAISQIQSDIADIKSTLACLSLKQGG